MSGKITRPPVDVSRALAALEPLARLVEGAKGVFEALRDARAERGRLSAAINQSVAEADKARKEEATARSRADREIGAIGERVAAVETKARHQLDGFQRELRQAEQSAVAAKQRARALDDQADREARDRKAALAKELAEEEKAGRGKLVGLAARVKDLDQQIADAEAKLTILRQAQEQIRRDAAAVASG